MIVQDEFDNQTLAQLEFEEYIEQLSEEIAPEIEIDSIAEEFGLLYRVWNGSQLLGTFYENLQGKWIAQPCNTLERPCCKTPDAAQQIIVVMNGLLVAGLA
jgi:hypothetical protein